MPSHRDVNILIRDILSRRTRLGSTGDERTDATIAVMLRVRPAPKALIAIAEPHLRRKIEALITADMLHTQSVSSDREALQNLAAAYSPVVVSDGLELIRQLRSRSISDRTPYVIYVSELDEAEDRELGLAAGADECVARSASVREFEARLGSAKRIAELESALNLLLEENRKLSAIDDLTRVASRRFFVKHFPREIKRAARHGRALSLILCDIDHFRRLNEALGHPGGDEILRQFGERVQKGLRRGIDWAARIGGEEFAIVLPERDYEAALHIARNIREAISRSAFIAGGKNVRVTVSSGLCGIDQVPSTEHRLAQRMMKIADAALYRSKHDGRNRVTAVMFDGLRRSPDAEIKQGTQTAVSGQNGGPCAADRAGRFRVPKKA
jgi:two-component system, cell cycle response regulator